jgi:hypothetical protein
MLLSLAVRRSLFAFSVIALPGLVAACDDDPVEPDPEPTFNRVEFTIVGGGQTRVVTVSTTGQQVGTANLPAGTTTATLSARFLNADNSVDQNVTAADFELRLESSNPAGITFTLGAGQSFSGTVGGLTDGTRVLVMQLFHLGEGHEDFEQPLTLQIG